MPKFRCIASPTNGLSLHGDITIQNTRNSRWPITLNEISIRPANRMALKEQVTKDKIDNSVIVTISGRSEDDHDWVRQFIRSDHLDSRLAGKKISSCPNENQYSFKIENCTMAEVATALAAPAKVGESPFITEPGAAEKLVEVANAAQKQYDQVIDDIRNNRPARDSLGSFSFDNTEQWEGAVEAAAASAQTRTGRRPGNR